MCAFSTLNIDSEVFLCFDGAEDSITYRARVLATAEVDTRSLSSYLEEWVAAGSSVVVGGVVLSVDEDCSGEIADLLQEEDGCRAEPTSSDSTRVVAGTVVGAIIAVLIVATVAILIIIVILKRRYVNKHPMLMHTTCAHFSVKVPCSEAKHHNRHQSSLWRYEVNEPSSSKRVI